MGAKVEFPTEPGYSRGTDHGDLGMSRTPLSRDQDHDTGQSSAQFGKDVAMIQSQCFARLRGVTLSWGLLIAVTCLTPAPAPAQSPQITQPPGTQTSGHHPQSTVPDDLLSFRYSVPPPMSAKQKLSIVHANFEKSKSDAAELAALAKELRKELDKPNVNVLSLEVRNRLEKIEKLARKIREETKGF